MRIGLAALAQVINSHFKREAPHFSVGLWKRRKWSAVVLFPEIAISWRHFRRPFDWHSHSAFRGVTFMNKVKHDFFALLSVVPIT
jgi:hypothetical protein